MLLHPTSEGLTDFIPAAQIEELLQRPPAEAPEVREILAIVAADKDMSTALQQRLGELVLVGGHLDSWDLGTGATDNRTGSVAAMETLRALAALKLRPRRTLRVVLFSGEEEGLMGSYAYVEAHPEEMARIQAVFIDDMGTGKITGWPDMGNEAHRAFLAKAMAPVNNLGCLTLGAFTGAGDTDHWPFHKAGVPAFPAIQEVLDYMTTTHHSQADTFDHVVPEDLIQGCQVLAAMAWETLNCPERLPHGMPARKE